MMSLQNMNGIASILSLIGGVVILIGGIYSTLWSTLGGFYANGMMGGFGVPFVGLLSGIVVIVGALMLNARPAEHMTWGTLILVFSIISFLGMNGFQIGALLGIAGGAVALSWRPVARA